MNNKISNKIIPIETIIKIADYFEDYKDEYARKYELDKNKNKDLSYSEQKWEYNGTTSNVKYTIELHNGKNMTETDYNWFLTNLNDPKSIKSITIELTISFFASAKEKENSDIYNNIGASVDFRDCITEYQKFSITTVDVTTTNQEDKAHNIYSEIINILGNTEDRYNKTIKNKWLRKQSFCVSIGIILSYIVYLILMINKEKVPLIIWKYLDNEHILIISQWVAAIVLGNIFGSVIIGGIYKPILPEAKFIGVNSSTLKSMYKDDIEKYKENTEVHIGSFTDAGKRRKIIEKLYKITSKVVIAQLLLSIILYFVIK